MYASAGGMQSVAILANLDVGDNRRLRRNGCRSGEHTRQHRAEQLREVHRARGSAGNVLTADCTASLLRRSWATLQDNGVSPCRCRFS